MELEKFKQALSLWRQIEEMKLLEENLKTEIKLSLACCMALDEDQEHGLMEALNEKVEKAIERLVSVLEGKIKEL